MRRCDEAGGLGGTGGWVGGCPYGTRGGFSWQVVFEPVWYNDVQHKFVDEVPLSHRTGKPR